MAKYTFQVYLILSALSLLSLNACSKEKPIKELLVNDESKSFYTIGQMLARKSDYLKLDERETEIVLRGFRDWSVKHVSEVDYDAQVRSVDRMISQRSQNAAQVQKDQGKAYLEKFVKSGATQLPSGLAYKVIKQGSAKKPRSSDSVEVHYQGTFIDGKVFDSSMGRAEKVKFPLNHVIPGWTEGLQLIGEGGEIELVIPSELAYGDQGAPPAIPGGATLVFKVQLFKIIEKNN